MEPKSLFLENFFGVLLTVLLLSIIFPLHLNAQSYELYTAQGIQKINEEKFDEALELLKKALELSPENPEATYYTAIAYSRLGNYKEAEELFFKTLELDETALNVYLELGRIYYIKSQCDKTAIYLSKFTSRSDNELAKGYAMRLIDNCKEETKEETKEKPYRLNITVGAQYDDNVILEPTHPIRDEKRESDVKAVLYLKSGATLLNKGAIKLKVDYSFYQSLHRRLDDFNIHYHKIAPALEIELSKVVKSTLGYTLGYTLFGGNLYSRVHTSYGKVKVKEGEKLSTEAIYEYSDNKYWNSDLFPTSSTRSGYKNTIGIKQNFHLNKLKIDIHYFSDFERTREMYWAFDGNRIGTRLLYKMTSPLGAKRPVYIGVSGEYNKRRYKDDFPGTQEKRLDKMQQYSIKLMYMLSKRMSISLIDRYTINDSNLSTFDYKRNIIGVFLTVRVL